MGTTGRSLRLSEGVHRLKVEYVQYEGGSQLKVLWAPAGRSAQSFRPESLFVRAPNRETLVVARRADLLRRSAAIVWPATWAAFAAVLGVFCIRQWRRLGVNGRLGRMMRHLHERYGAWTEQHSPAGRLVFAVVVAGVTLGVILARLPGLNPESLWYNDLAWATLTRADSLRAMLRIPSHAPPGFLALLRVSRDLFSDPEWSVQLPPFICGVAAVPVMALVVRRLTRSLGLGILAAGLTALNPLLAHYTLYVKRYSLDFLMTAILLLAGASLLDGHEIRPRKVAELTLFSAFALLFSVGSVFVSFPVMSVIIVQALLARRGGTRAILLVAVAFALVLVAGFFLFRSRTGELMRYDFRRNLLGRSYRLLRGLVVSLHGWKAYCRDELAELERDRALEPDNRFVDAAVRGPGVHLAVCAEVEPPHRVDCAWIHRGVFRRCVHELVPLTNDRRSMFAFPVFICLAVMGFHLVTEWLPRREVIRLVAGVAVAAFSLGAPIRAQYWRVNDVRLIQRVADLPQGDGLILSPAGAYLAGYYGPWPITIAGPEERRIDGQIGFVRNLTVVGVTKQMVEGFLGRAHPTRLWYVAFRTSDEAEADVLEALNERGYTTEQVEFTTRGTLYRGVLR